MIAAWPKAADPLLPWPGMQPPTTHASDVRSQLAAILAGHGSVQGFGSLPFEAVLACSQAEGVCALLAARLDASDDIPAELSLPLQQRARGMAAAELAKRAELRRVLATLDRAGIPVLVLKGHALGQWLYPAPYLRECSDIDLLFADRTQAEVAAAALDAMGYVVPYRPGRFAHELLCRRQGVQIDLDMHWALAAIPALDRLPGFAQLLADAVALPGLGASAKGLDPVAALLHACVHRASNLGARLGDRLKWLYDIHLLALGFSDGQWERFVVACRDARICGMAASGLDATQAAFATMLPATVMQALRQAAGEDALDATRLADWRYVERRNLLALQGLPAKVHWLRARVFPPTGYLHELYGREHGWSRLMWQRLVRLLARVTSRPGSAHD